MRVLALETLGSFNLEAYVLLPFIRCESPCFFIASDRFPVLALVPVSVPWGGTVSKVIYILWLWVYYSLGR